MNRRKFLLMASTTAAVAIVAGGATVALKPVRDGQGRFTPEVADIWHRVGRVMLEGMWPDSPVAADAARLAWIARLEDTVSQLAPTSRAELERLLSLLRWSLPRRWLLELNGDWATSTDEAIRTAFERTSRADTPLRQQAFSALRDLSLAAFYADPSNWTAIGYPGPNAIGAAS
jgi:hypothetical protein